MAPARQRGVWSGFCRKAVTIRVSTRSVPDAWRDYLCWTGEIEHDEAEA